MALGTKTLTEDADVYNGVQMLTGILETGAYRLKLNTLANLSETDASYVLGRVEVRRTPAAGGPRKLWRGRPANDARGGFHGSRLDAGAPHYGQHTAGLGRQRRHLRYFDITPTTNSGLNVTLTISYLNHELNGIAPANLRFFKSINSGASWINMGRSSGTASSVTLNGVSGFSRWTLGDETWSRCRWASRLSKLSARGVMPC
jgi:hypothetical protein